MGLAVADTAETHYIVYIVLAFAPAMYVMQVISSAVSPALLTTEFAANNVLLAYTKMPEVNSCVRGHSFARNFLNSSSIAAMIRSLVSLSGYSTWITSP